MGVGDRASFDYSSAILDALRRIEEAVDVWIDRATPCGLLDGRDDPLGYGNIPDSFRAFASWGVDGVHEGFWIDDRHQAHEPFIVKASPMDFSEAMILQATDADDWLERVQVESAQGFTDEAQHRFGTRAESRRRALGLEPIPSVFDEVAMALGHFDERYRSAFAELGLALEAAHRIGAGEVPALPLAMRAYYQLAGRHPINSMHNRLVAPEALVVGERRLVFMTENQHVAEWAVETHDADDPMVFQGTHSPDATTAWYSEELRFSDFIIAMVRWTVTGE